MRSPLPRALALCGALAVLSAAAPAAPGSVVQTQTVYLAGEAMNGQWEAVASKKSVGSNGKDAFYQWYLSIYAKQDDAYVLKYESPTNGGPLAKVTQVSGGAKMWFPIQDLKIVGQAELMQPGVQQLVVQSHEMAADCGNATVTVFATDAKGDVVPAVSVQNGCELQASITTAHGHAAVRLSGPYYSPTAAMCCPTKPKASAVLEYAGGKWSETPKYYNFYPGKFAP